MAFCTQCGAPSSGTLFCGSCGARLDGDEPTTAAAELSPTVASDGHGTRAATPVSANGVAAHSTSAPPFAQTVSRAPSAGPEPTTDSTGVVPVGTPATFGSGRPTGESGKHLNVGQLSSAQTTTAGKDGLLALLGVLGLTTIITAVLAGLLGAQGHHGSPLDWFHAAVVVLGLSVHAAVELHVSQTGTDGPVSGAVTAGLHLMPFLVTLLIATALHLLGRRSERKNPSSSIRECGTQALVTGAVFGGGAALLATITSGPVGFGTAGSWFDDSVSASLGVNPWQTLLGAFVVAALGTLLGRSTGFARRHRVTLGQAAGARWAAWVDDARTARALLLGVLLVAIVSVLVAAAGHLVPMLWSHHGSSGTDADSSGGSAWRSVVFMLAGALLMLVNLLLILTGFVLGGTLGVSGGGDARSLLTDNSWSPHLGAGVGLLAGGVPAAFYLAWFLLLVVTLMVGVRAAFRSSPGAEIAPRAARTLVVFAAGWALVSWLARVTVHVSGQASALSAQGAVAGHAGAGLGVGSTVGAAIIWALVCAVGGNYLTRWVGAALPGLSARLAGRHLHPQWSLLLADATMQRGRRVPASLVGAAGALRQGVVPDAPRLDVRPRRVRIFFGVAAAVVVLAVAAPVGYEILNTMMFGAGSVAAEYVNDLSHRNTSGALRLVDPESLHGLDKALLVPAAVKTPPQLISVVSTTVDNDTATVVVKERINGQTRRASFTLQRSGNRAVLFDRWVLESPFSDVSVTTDVPSPGNYITVNGMPADYGHYPVFPGTYQVNLAASEYYDAASTVVAATGAGSEQVDFAPAVNPHLQTAADNAVKDLLDSCAAEGIEEPMDCPLDYTSYEYDPLDNVTWNITSYPYADVTINDDGSVTVDADGSGMASISGTGTDWDLNPVPVQDSTSISSFTGTLNWDGSDPSSATMSYDY